MVQIGGFCPGVGRIFVVIWICCLVGGGVWMGFWSASFGHHVSASWSLAGRRHGTNRSGKLRNGMMKSDMWGSRLSPKP